VPAGTIPQLRQGVDPLRYAPRWGANMVRALVWWPALSMIAVAARPGSDVVMIAGFGVGLLVLGLVNTVVQAWLVRLAGEGHRANPANGLSGGAPSTVKMEDQLGDAPSVERASEAAGT
jgi:hypothetical protein